MSESETKATRQSYRQGRGLSMSVARPRSLAAIDWSANHEPRRRSPTLDRFEREIDARIARDIHAAHKRLARGYLRQDPRVVFLSPRAIKIVGRFERRHERAAQKRIAA